MGIEAEIQEWHKDIALMDTPRGVVSMLVYAWNWATNPRALRTDEEHIACREFAQQIRARLETVPGWQESEGGWLFV